MFPALVCRAPAAIVLTAAPPVLLVTFTITVQPPAGMLVPFASVKLPAPAAAVTPKHVPVFPAVLIVIPSGKVSVKALVSVIALAFVFPIVTVKFVFPPLARFPAAKAFAIVGAAITVSVSVAELFPRIGSVVPTGVAMFATFAMLPPTAVTVALTVKVTLPPLGKVGITIPAPRIKATVVFGTVGQAAAPVAVPHVTPVTFKPAINGSVNTALFAAEGPAFVTTIVYVVVPPALTLATPSVFVMSRFAVGVATMVTSSAVLLAELYVDVRVVAATVRTGSRNVEVAGF